MIRLSVNLRSDSENIFIITGNLERVRFEIFGINHKFSVEPSEKFSEKIFECTYYRVIFASSFCMN